MLDNELDNSVSEDVQAEPAKTYLDQEHTNKIAQAAYARGKKSAESELAKKISELEALVKGKNEPYNELGSKSIDEEALLRKAEERAAERYRREQEAFRQSAEEQESEKYYASLARKFNKQIEKGRQSFDDFDEKLKKFDPKLYANFAIAVAELDDENSEEILYNLLDRPSRISEINRLRAEGNAQGAKDELRRLSKSIAKNREGKESFKRTSAPLSKLNPSSSGLSGNSGTPSRDQLKSRGLYRF